jgi:signal transduction histidine kinase
MEPTSGDEIGQLIRAFNDMTATIQEKQRIAKEEETQRIRMEKEALQKAKDLEMSELKTRALQAENERKTVELEKAKELEKAYGALELAHKELKEAQAQLIQSGKMASLGNLVAGVAHEINNPVGAMNSAADVSRRAVEKMAMFFDDEQTQKDANVQARMAEVLKILKDNTQLICTGSSRVAKIVRSLKTFARLDEAEFQKTDIHQGLDSTLMLLQHELKNRITVEKEYREIPEISCYPDELNQVFMNLLSNAAQAIENKGTIRIRTRVKNDTLQIDIEDNGRGIPQENVEKIFDPGFTTKGVGVGTGLGLSISYKIIQKHQGEIKVKSKVGKGSTFTVFIPINLEERITETSQTESD